jgi:aspartate racemase
MTLGHENGHVIGIVGGMGPDAGIYLAQQITELTRAGIDESDMDVILASCPRGISDRTEFVLGHTDENPANSINPVIDRLARAGATVVGMACNTAHAAPILDMIERHMKDHHPTVTLVSMVETVKTELLDLGPGGRVAVLGTLGTYVSDIYGKALHDSDWSIRYLDTQSDKERLHRLIYAPSWGLKATGPALSDRAAEELHRVVTGAAELADVVLLACTELSMAADGRSFDAGPMIDSSYALARRLVSISRRPGTQTVE